MKVASGLFFLIAISIAGCEKKLSVDLKVDCGAFNNSGAVVSINDEIKGECPLGVKLVSGDVKVEALRKNDDLSFYYAVNDFEVFEHTSKLITLNLVRQFPEEYYFKESVNLSGMLVYLEKYPDGRYFNIVMDRLENFYFDLISDIATAEQYLKVFPQGRRSKEVEAILNEMYFKNIPNLEIYIARLPMGFAKKRALDKLEQMYFENVNDVNGAKAYLINQPEGKRRGEVIKKLRVMINEELNLIGFRDNFDGTVTHLDSKLRWKRCSVGQVWTGETCSEQALYFDWKDAMGLAKDGWRIPTVEELDLLVFCSKGSRMLSARPGGKFDLKTLGRCPPDSKAPTINESIFPNTPKEGLLTWYWTSTRYIDEKDSAWRISFFSGQVSPIEFDYVASVRLVRDEF